MKTGLNTGATILLVDDEESDLELGRDALKAAGHRVLTASDSAEALNVFDANHASIDMMVVDISLPDGNGCDLALSLFNRNRGVRVLFISGHVGAEICRYYGLDVNNERFLGKPFTGAELVSRVRQVLEASEPFPRMSSPKSMTGTSGGGA